MVSNRRKQREQEQAEWSEWDERHGRKSREVAGATEIQWSERDERPAANEFQTLKARRRGREVVPLRKGATDRWGDIYMMTYNTKAYSAASATSPLASTTIPRRGPTEHDVQIEILFCGICHSDLHQVRNEWSGVMPTVYPIVPGHEIVGRVTKVGSDVNKY